MPRSLLALLMSRAGPMRLHPIKDNQVRYSFFSYHWHPKHLAREPYTFVQRSVQCERQVLMLAKSQHKTPDIFSNRSLTQGPALGVDGSPLKEFICPGMV